MNIVTVLYRQKKRLGFHCLQAAISRLPWFFFFSFAGVLTLASLRMRERRKRRPWLAKWNPVSSLLNPIFIRSVWKEGFNDRQAVFGMSRIDLTKIDWRSIKYCYNILAVLALAREASKWMNENQWNMIL